MARIELGPIAPLGGKQRKVVLVKSDLDIENTFNRLSSNIGVHTFQSDGMILSMVFKEKLDQVKDFVVHSVKTKGKYTNGTDLVKLWESIKNAAFKSNVAEKAIDHAGNMPDIKVAVEQYWLQGWKVQDWPIVHGNALKAKQEKILNAFQLGVVTYAADMERLLQLGSVVGQVLLPCPSRYHFIDDFIKEKAFNLKGKHLVKRNGEWIVEEIALKEILWASQDKHSVYGLYKEKTLIFNGNASMGKTEFVKGLASEFASCRDDKEVFGWGTICNFGAVTKADRMKDAGCFVFDDFDLTTRGGTHRLTKEELKHLLYVQQEGHVCAFYSTAVFPAHVPRIWCVNYRCQRLQASWFEENYIPGLAHLCNGEASLFNGPGADQHDVAIARRAVIFEVAEALFEQPVDMVPRYSELAGLEPNASPCLF